MSLEITMNGMNYDVQSVAAILCAVAALVVLAAWLHSHTAKVERKVRFYSFINEETESALISADRVLKNGATPPVVRRHLICMLETLATEDLGKDFSEFFVSQIRATRRRRPGSDDDLSIAMDRLHADNPALAADAQKALMGIILAIPLMYAEKIELTEYAAEGATNPAGMFGKAVAAMSQVGRHREAVAGNTVPA